MGAVRASNVIRFAALAGLALCLYALYIERAIIAAESIGATYKAACDIGTFASCSKVLGSSYAHVLSHWGLVKKFSVFDLSNALLGAFFYCFAMIHHELTFLPYRELLLLVSTGSLGFSLYLAYVLKFVLNDFCLVCMGMYTVNIIIFLAAAKQVLRPSKPAVAVEHKKAE